MNDETRAKIGNVFCEVLEKLPFMFGEMVEKDEMPPVTTLCVKAKMNFSGDQSGSISLSVPVEMCPEIAANVLGMELDEKLVMEQAGDALKELLNVTCGNILTTIAGEKPIFDLSVPKVIKIDAMGWQKLLEDENTLPFMVDDSAVLLNFFFDE